MYRDRIENINSRSPAAQRLKDVLIRYHDFQHQTIQPVDPKLKNQLADWQCKRLLKTHQDLYKSPNFTKGIEFLFSDLYAAHDFSDRDRDLERIAPKLVKLLPDKIIHTVAHLIELNLCTQKMDTELAHALFTRLNTEDICEARYCEAYRLCNNQEQRAQQLRMIEEVGSLLDKYARSRLILFSLSVSQGPAESAGLSALHQFIQRGFQAFHTMQNIQGLMSTLLSRERQILENIYSNKPSPFDWK